MTRPPIPDVPACHTWPLPPLPVRNDMFEVRGWQAGRCAVCADTAGGLFEDHDHDTGDSRGYLCPRCNTAEGQTWAPPVFDLYRKRHPAALLGVLDRRRRNRHPAVEDADRDLGDAFNAVRAHADPDEWRASRAVLGRPPDLPDLTPLATALQRVGLTCDEWAETRARRDRDKLVPAVHLPTATTPPADACDPLSPWRPPPRSGARRKPCPECWAINPDRMRFMVGDGTGPDRDTEMALLAAAWL